MQGLLVITICSILGIVSCGSEYQKSNDHQKMTDQNQTNKNPYYSRTDTTHLNVSDKEWEKVLAPEVYYISREKGTERAFTGKYW
ncbi:MAG: peptide-methionine (R)-S-oxide reductase, partial [Bacteroidota bacterium]